MIELGATRPPKTTTDGGSLKLKMVRRRSLVHGFSTTQSCSENRTNCCPMLRHAGLYV